MINYVKLSIFFRHLTHAPAKENACSDRPDG